MTEFKEYPNNFDEVAGRIVMPVAISVFAFVGGAAMINKAATKFFPSTPEARLEFALEDNQSQIEMKVMGTNKWELPKFRDGKLSNSVGLHVEALSRAEGNMTRSDSGEVIINESYWGHGDPNAGVLNMGAFSVQIKNIDPNQLDEKSRVVWIQAMDEIRASGLSTTHAPSNPAQLRILHAISKRYNLPTIADNWYLKGLKGREALVLSECKKRGVEPTPTMVLSLIDWTIQVGSTEEVIKSWLDSYLKNQDLAKTLTQMKAENQSKLSLDKYLNSQLDPKLINMPARPLRDLKGKNIGGGTYAIDSDTFFKPGVQFALNSVASCYNKGVWDCGGYTLIKSLNPSANADLTPPQIAFADRSRRITQTNATLQATGAGPTLTYSQLNNLDNGSIELTFEQEQSRDWFRFSQFSQFQQFGSQKLSEITSFTKQISDPNWGKIVKDSGISKLQTNLSGFLQTNKETNDLLQNSTELGNINLGIELEFESVLAPDQVSQKVLEYIKGKGKDIQDFDITNLVEGKETAYSLGITEEIVPKNQLKEVFFSDPVMNASNPENFRGYAHPGNDIVFGDGSAGVPIPSLSTGVVVKTVEGIGKQMGMVVIQTAPDKSGMSQVHTYLHSEGKAHVNVGDVVIPGTVLAYQGNTGLTSRGTHTHLTILNLAPSAPTNIKQLDAAVYKGFRSNYDEYDKGNIKAGGKQITHLVARLYATAFENDPKAIENLIRKSSINPNITTLGLELTGKKQSISNQQFQQMLRDELGEKSMDLNFEEDKSISKAESIADPIDISGSTQTEQTKSKINERYNQLLLTQGVKLLPGADLNYVNQGLNYAGVETVDRGKVGWDVRCYAAVTVSALRYFEIIKGNSQDLSSEVPKVFEHIKEWFFDPYDLKQPILQGSNDKMREYINNYGLKTKTITWKFEAIKQQIDGYHPIVMIYRRNVLGNLANHSVLIVGYKKIQNEEYLIVHDPQFNQLNYKLGDSTFNLDGALAVYDFKSIKPNTNSFVISR